MEKKCNKKPNNLIIHKNEYFVTVCIFLIMIAIIFAVFFAVAYESRLSAAQNSVDNISNYLVVSYTRYLDEVNTISKQTFIDEDMMKCQDDYLSSGSNDTLYARVANQFEAHNSSLIVGMGYIPYDSSGYVCKDIVYSGTKTISFGYIDDSSKALIDSVASKGNDSSYDSGKMFLVYSDKWDIHIFARVVKDIRLESFDRLSGIGFVVVNSAVFRQQKKFGDVIDGFSSFVVFDGEPILNEHLPVEKMSNDAYYVYRNGFSQYCEYYGVYNKSSVWKGLLPDTIAMTVTFVVVFILFITFYKRTHDKFTRSFVYLVDQFQRIGGQTDLAPIELADDDENVNQVIATYNQMVANVLAEREKNERLSEENRQIELQSLYQQINRHFVINVLSAVHSLILLNKRDKANECVENLADFLRYSLSINVTEAPLNDEIDSALSYVNLQKLRFPNVEFAYSVSGDMTDIVVPKSIIQPLIENAYVHGIKNKKGSIDLTVERNENKLTIKVVNSGAETDSEQLAEVNKIIADNATAECFSENGHGIALKNIRKRLQLRFASAEVFLSSNDEKTTATIEVSLAIASGKK